MLWLAGSLRLLDLIESPATMALESAERLYLERQVTLARVVLVALALVALLEMSGGARRRAPVLFLAVYLVVALAVVLYQRVVSEAHFQIPLAADVAALAVFLIFNPPASVSWFLFLFVVFALATRGNTNRYAWLGERRGRRRCAARSCHGSIQLARTLALVIDWIGHFNFRFGHRISGCA